MNNGHEEDPVKAPPPPALAQRLLGPSCEAMQSYVELLADTGTSHGLIGPREVPRLWERHILGCAIVAELLPQGMRVADIGSGAGLPGLVLAIARPDLEMCLVEPLQRRVTWLESTIATLGLNGVTVHHGRAESLWGHDAFDVVTARAVARIGRLAQWCVPLLAPQGRVLALKGERGPQELDEDASVVSQTGVTRSGIVQLGVGVLEPPTTVVALEVGPDGPPPLTKAQRRQVANLRRTESSS